MNLEPGDIIQVNHPVNYEYKQHRVLAGGIGALCGNRLQKTDDVVTPTITSVLNCATTTLSTSSFTSNGTAQSTTLTVGLTDATVGSTTTFAIASSGADFTPTTFTTAITAGQATVAIPPTFDPSNEAATQPCLTMIG